MPDAEITPEGLVVGRWFLRRLIAWSELERVEVRERRHTVQRHPRWEIARRGGGYGLRGKSDPGEVWKGEVVGVLKLLTPETATRLLARFHDFDDAVVLGVRLSFSYGPSAGRPDAVVTLQAQDQAGGGEWGDVSLSLAGVVSYCLTENSREFHRVLSDGLSILWNEDGTVTIDIENLGRDAESSWFIRAASCECEDTESP